MGLRQLGLVFVALAIVAGVTVVADSPLEARRDRGGWLALGDSYSSGHGIPGTLPREVEGSGMATQGRDCRRATGSGTSATAWPVGAFRSVQGRLGLDEIALVACSGAITGEIDDQVEEAASRFGRDRWDIVSFSIGGNDIGFAEVLKGCLDFNSLWGFFDLSPGCDVSEADMRSRIDGLRHALGEVYDGVADVVRPGGDVIVLGYPQIVEEVSRWEGWRRTVTRGCEGIMSWDVGMLRSVTGYLNQQIGLAVLDADARHRERGIRFHFLDIAVDPYEYSGRATDRHALCSNDPWLNGVTVDITSGDWPDASRSFHPHQTGHTNTARVLATYIDDHVTLDDIPVVDIAALRGAEVPSLCGHPAGRLVDGRLPGIPVTRGFVSLDLTGDLRGRDRLPVTADFDDDGVPEALVVADCSQGGVGWPNSLLLYGPGPRFLDEFNVDQIVDRGLQDYEGDRSGVRALEERDGRAHVAWLVHRSGDPGAGGSLPIEVVLDVADGQFTVVEVIRRDERLTLDGIIAAANRRDRAGLDRYALGPFVAEDLIAAVETAGEFIGYECLGSLDWIDYGWVRGDFARSCQLTQAGGYTSWAYLNWDDIDSHNWFNVFWRLETYEFFAGE
jgi:hypothetical protein